jgi:hypothetical protein
MLVASRMGDQEDGKAPLEEVDYKTIPASLPTPPAPFISKARSVPKNAKPLLFYIEAEGIKVFLPSL